MLSESELHTAKILIVDDNPSDIFLCHYLLENAGYRCLIGTTRSEEVVGLHADHAFDLILLDLNMPGMNGFDVMRGLASRGADFLPVIMVTADAQQKLDALELGAAGFIAKPYDNAELLACARNVLRNSLLQKALESRIAAQQKLADQLQLYRTATENVGDALFLIDEQDDAFIDVSSTACRLLGYERDELLNLSPSDVGFTGYAEPLPEGEPLESADFDTDVPLHCAGGSRVSVETRTQEIRRGQRRIVAVTARDIRLRSETEQRLRVLADFDPLTGLPNRRQFFGALQHMLGYAAHMGCPVAVLFIDLDRFKVINDNLGHPMGDILLRDFGTRMAGCVRARDVVARLGGDEFAVLMLLHDSSASALNVATKIRDILSEPFRLKDHELSVTASIGIAIYPDDTDDPDLLLQYADIAMYRAKESGRNTYRFFTPAMNARGLERLELEGALRKAVEHGGFCLHYQPKLDSRTGRVMGVEALLRWDRPGHGLMMPSEFIPLLEESGMIVKLGSWVIETACKQLGEWREAGLPPVNVAVNVSPRQFFDGELKNTIARAIEESGISPSQLELEITESMLMSNAEEMIAYLSLIKQLGVKIAIDDFGTGYSSLAYLKRFPIDTIKIDIAFVRDIVRNSEDAAIAQAIINMAHGLRMRVVAEGVESLAQLLYLNDHHCDETQGFYFSRPLPAWELAEFLQSNWPAASVPHRGPPGEKTLLVIDDDPGVGALLEELLGEDGYRILHAGSAAEGYEMLGLNSVGVILCDERMPDVTGTEFFRHVKKLYPSTLRIAMSGYADHETVAAAVNEGAIYKYLFKPWDNDELRVLVAEAFDYLEAMAVAH